MKNKRSDNPYIYTILVEICEMKENFTNLLARCGNEDRGDGAPIYDDKQ